MAKIFVNYRRDDAAGDARGVHNGLASKFGRSNVFMDVDNLLAGQRFDMELAKALDACDVLIAIIGPRWMELLKARMDTGERDYVREEIAAALARKIVVIPVRVGRDGQMPPMPHPDDLPEDIRDLVLYQKHDVAHERFGRDISDLVQAIAAVRKAVRRGRTAARSNVPWAVIGAGAAILGIGLAAAYNWPPAAVSLPSASDATSVEKSQKPQEDEARAKSKQAAKAAQEAKEKKAEADVQAEKDRQQLALLKKQEAAAEAERQRRAEDEARRDPALAITPGSGQSFRDNLADGKLCPICPELVVAPQGSFTMGSPDTEERWSGYVGSEGSPHKVTFSRPFAVGKHAITFDEWDACVADKGCNGYRPSDIGWGRGKRPVINVNWEDAKSYAAWLSSKTGKTYRLLSEAEREYVTRAGTTTPFWWGSTSSPKQANFDGNYTYGSGAKGEYRQKTVAVDSFEPNRWGLYQVHGNVWEWCEDNWHANYSGNPPKDGSVWQGGDTSLRVLRGGSWISNPDDLRSAIRYVIPPDYRYDVIGFRLARTL